MPGGASAPRSASAWPTPTCSATWRRAPFGAATHADAIAWSNEAGAAAEAMKDRDLIAIVRCGQGHALHALGDWQAAAQAYRESSALFRELGRVTMPPEPMAGLARVALARGDTAAALAIVEEIAAHLDGGGSVDGTEDPLWIHLTCHRVFAAAGEARAAEYLRHAHELLMARSASLADGERGISSPTCLRIGEIVEAWAGRAGSAVA